MSDAVPPAGSAAVAGSVPLGGELTVTARLRGASNATFLAEIAVDDEPPVQCVYKPIRGERPLWDFPDGTLAGREVATYRVARALDWPVVPPTVLRDGPAGPGMVQAWVPAVDAAGPDPVDVFDPGAVPEDYLAILSAEDGHGRPLVLAHADDPRLWRIAVLDVIVNNPDRKGGHVLVGPGDRWYAIDHGICLHAEPKLRTVLWGWAGRPVPEDLQADLARLAAEFGAAADCTALGLEPGTITEAEFEALAGRTAELAADPVMPEPVIGPAIPWPPL